jgi:polyhydroxyalkanoate synthesis regulator phasin
VFLYNEYSNGNNKSTIRLFKNLRNELVDKDVIEKEEASSYYIDCLLSNVETTTIAENDIRKRVEGILDELKMDTQDNFSGYTVQHGMRPLFGNGVAQWEIEYAKTFVEEACRLYDSG